MNIVEIGIAFQSIILLFGSFIVGRFIDLSRQKKLHGTFGDKRDKTNGD